MSSRRYGASATPPSSVQADLRSAEDGGVMGGLILGFDWAESRIGEPPAWPQSLRTAVRLILHTRFPMYIFWGADNVGFYNDAYAESMGPEQHPRALGRPAADVWAGIWSIIGPQIEQVRAGHGATWHEDQLVPITRHGKSENSYWTYSYSPIVEDSARNGIGGVLVVCTETTRQVELARSLAASQERLNQALSAGGGVGTWEWDVANDLVFADERFARLYGVDPRRAQSGAPLSDFFAAIHPDDAPVLREQIDKALAGVASFSAEYRLVGTPAEICWVLAEGRCEFDAERRPFRLSGVSVDITRRKLAERNLRDSEARHRDELEAEVLARTRDLAQANLALESANQALVVSRDAAQESTRAKSAFLANMSHEIRTPMNAIIGLTHLLSRATLDDYQSRRVDEVSSAAQHLLGLIDDILDLSKIEAGRLVLDSAEFATADFIDAALAMLRERARAKGLELQLDAGGLPSRLRGDKVKLSQILINLLSNAVKFTDSGFVKLRAQVLEEEQTRLRLLFEVEDSGPGIAPERQALLFNAFEQADDSLSRRHGGTGLGLALSRQLARAMGGEASFSSEPGVGSTFRFTAWLDRGSDAVLPADARQMSPAGEAERLVRERHGGRRVLLAEDNPINRFVALEFLRSAGLLVETAVDGAEAVSKAELGTFDLVLMDVQMPLLDGLQATRTLRAHGHAVPIIAMTANAYVEDRLACLSAGMNDHITKPVEPASLFSLLLRWLDNIPSR